MIDPGTGLHPGISFEDYLRIARMNNSHLKHIGTSPAHYLHHQSAATEDTDALLRGRATSMAICEPEKFRSKYYPYEDRRAGKAWDAFEAKVKLAGAEVLTSKMHDDVAAISKAVRSSAMAAPFLTNGRGEVTMCWTHVVPAVAGLEGYKIDCKARLDFEPKVGTLADLKTTRDASPDAFGRQAFNLDYHVQAAWYVDGYERITGEHRPFFLIAVESKPPHVVQVYQVTEDQLELGREVYRERLDLLNMCRRDSNWPGYATTPMDLVLPPWATPDDEQDVGDLGIAFGDASPGSNP